MGDVTQKLLCPNPKCRSTRAWAVYRHNHPAPGGGKMFHWEEEAFSKGGKEPQPRPCPACVTENVPAFQLRCGRCGFVHSYVVAPEASPRV